MSGASLSKTTSDFDSPGDRRPFRKSPYVATAAEAVKNWQQNRANRWYKDGADPTDLRGDYAFQRLRQTFFTPKIEPKLSSNPRTNSMRLARASRVDWKTFSGLAK